MNERQVESLIRGLGLHYDELNVEGVLTQGELVGLEGLDWLVLDPEPGVEISFHADSKVFFRVNFSLRKTFPEEDIYLGELPEPFRLNMAQSEMHGVLGAPAYSSGPIKMPQPIGQTGGWESFSLDQKRFPDVMAVLQYTEQLEVCGLVFESMSEDG